MKRLLSQASKGALLIGLFISTVANACPACAGRADSHPWATAALIAGLISMPYIIGAVVVRAVRKLDDGSYPEDDGSSPE